MFKENYATRSIVTGAFLTLILTLLIWMLNQPRWAGGFLIGSVVSMFSIISMLVLVPFLMSPNAPKYSITLLATLLFMKVPLYAAAIFLLVSISGGHPSLGFILCSILGLGLIPFVLTMKAIGQAVIASHGVGAPRQSLRETLAAYRASKTIQNNPPVRAADNKLAGEGG